MNVFDMLTGKHNKFVSEIDDDSMIITNKFLHFEQTNEPNKCYLKNNNKNNNDEISYPLSKKIKLKHEPEAAPEKKPVQYTTDTIVKIKNRDGTVVPMRSLLDTGTTSTIILREFVGKGRALTNTKKRTKCKTLGGTFTTNYESLLDFKFPEISTIKVVTWQAHVDDKTSSKEAAYDMIMGIDLMKSIGITVDCEQRCIIWGGTEIPLKTRTTLNNDEILHMLYHAENEPDILQEAEKRQHRILDVD
jgi:predicted aspartyl protease